MFVSLTSAGLLAIEIPLMGTSLSLSYYGFAADPGASISEVNCYV